MRIQYNGVVGLYRTMSSENHNNIVVIINYNRIGNNIRVPSLFVVVIIITTTTPRTTDCSRLRSCLLTTRPRYLRASRNSSARTIRSVCYLPIIIIIKYYLCVFKHRRPVCTHNIHIVLLLTCQFANIVDRVL